MKRKILFVGIMLSILCISSTGLSSEVIISDDMIDKDIIEINVAIMHDDKLGWGCAKLIFVELLNDYEWTVGNTTYRFHTTPIYDEDILRGRLNTDNYDVFLFPGGGAGDGNSIVRGLTSFTLKTKRWKNQINKFIEDGGGYSGYCGGTMIATEFFKDPGYISGKIYDKGSLDFSQVKMYLGEEKVGLRGIGPAMYIASNHMPKNVDQAQNNKRWEEVESGACIDMQINHDSPIFDDYLKDTCKARWAGGSALIIPDDCESETQICARYPELDIHENETYRLHEWRYVGGLRGVIKGFFRCRKVLIEYNKPLPPKPFAIGICSSDWEKTDELVNLNFSNKPGIVTEIYPNENEGRVILNGLHPEWPVWFGGRIVETEDYDDNNLLEGLFRWEDRVPWDQTPEDEFTYTWWIVRRSIAWAAKLPDNALPPIYGPSQVCDFEENKDTHEFTIEGNSEITSGLVTLDLYYRYSSDNKHWSDWIFYGTDDNITDGFCWDFDAPMGNGYYEFYSIRKVHSSSHTEIEKSPPGPDARVFLEGE